MEKVLIVFGPTSQVHLVSRLLEEMRNFGLCINAFNSTEWRFIDNNDDIPFFFKILRPFLTNRYFKVLFQRLFLKILLLSISARYDLVDIHYFSAEYISFLKSLTKPFKITIWGSDFYRMSADEAKNKIVCYEKASMIQCETNTGKRDLIGYLPSIENKIRVCNFGIDIIDDIERIVGQNRLSSKYVVTCGYNGSKGQQHLKMIEALNSLPLDIKNRITAFFPLTYGLERSYRTQLIEALHNVDYEYKVFETRLSDEELARLRIESDIALNIQITDSLSSSLLQHLFAGSIVIVGDWLPYEIYDENKFFYLTTSIQSLSSTLEDCILNIDNYKEKAKDNRERVRLLSSWSVVAKKQISIYKELISNYSA